MGEQFIGFGAEVSKRENFSYIFADSNNVQKSLENKSLSECNGYSYHF